MHVCLPLHVPAVVCPPKAHSSFVLSRSSRIIMLLPARLLMPARLAVLIVVALFIIKTVSGDDAAQQRILFTALDDALDGPLFEKLPSECEAVHSWSTAPVSSLMHGKRPTFWYDMVAPPRNNIEVAILHLHKLIPSIMLTNDSSSVITGAEWWVQIRANEEGIGFHYDKDEGLASLKGIMKHPMLSTVTYLSNIGAPTLILNMTTPDGNTEIPAIPDMGYLSYPKANRHILFSGNMQHGVLGSAAPKIKSKRKSAKSKRRITLLINWWIDAPIEPNTVVLTDELAASINIYAPESIYQANQEQSVSVGSQGDVAAAALHVPRAVPVTTLVIPDRSTNTAIRHQIEFPPGDMHFMYLPPSIEPQGIYQATWGLDQVFGAVGKLDLVNSNQVGQLFRLPQPKFLFLYDHKDQDLYESLLDAALPLAKDWEGKIKFYFCPTNTCKDALNAFGLMLSDLPRAVIDDTKSGVKYVQNKTDWHVSRDSFESFLATTPFKVD